jgi:hypothetical protein
MKPLSTASNRPEDTSKGLEMQRQTPGRVSYALLVAYESKLLGRMPRASVLSDVRWSASRLLFSYQIESSIDGVNQSIR